MDLFYSMKGEDEVFSLSFAGLDFKPGDCENSFGVGLALTFLGEGNSFSIFL